MAALTSPPSPSKACAISSGEWVGVPLNSMCSRKWEIPASSMRSKREPTPIQTPMATERTPGTGSETIRSPPRPVLTTGRCDVAAPVTRRS